MSIAENIKKIRLEHGLSQAELGKIAGVSDKAVSTWELGTKIPRMGAVEKMANYFGIPKSAIVDDAPAATTSRPIPPGFQPMPEMDWVPLVGRIACGTPITAEENVEQMVCVPSRWHSTFTLTCKGDSMEPRIHDGDLALVHRQDTLENGDLGVLIYGDEGEGTLKRYLQRGNCVVLQPFNPAYKEMVIKGEELNHLHIAGRVVETKAKW